MLQAGRAKNAVAVIASTLAKVMHCKRIDGSDFRGSPVERSFGLRSSYAPLIQLCTLVCRQEFPRTQLPRRRSAWHQIRAIF